MMQSNSVGDMVVHMREIAVYVCWGVVLDEGVNGLITYVGWEERMYVDFTKHGGW